MSTSSWLQTPHRLDLTGRVVLLATDGSAGAVAGAHVAVALAVKHRAEVHVVSVVDTRGAPIPSPVDLAVSMCDAAVGPSIHAEQEHQVRAALSTATGHEIAWPVRVMLGVPAKAIVEEARHLDAALIIVGLRQHGRVDRVLNDETTLEVMRHASCPVLGVVQGTTGLPTRVLAAMDFGETSLIAAGAARTITAANARFVLAYVEALTAFLPDDGELEIHNLGVKAAFARTARELGRSNGDHIVLDDVVLHREVPRSPAEVLLDYADDANVDLIAAGSARHGRVDRWMLGSVSAELVRDGRRSVLIVPPRAASPASVGHV
ncbi:MAG: universal stress protein [bacterium]